MPLHPAPTIANNLCLITQPLRHSLVGRDAQVTFALVNATADATQDVINEFQTNWNTNIAPTLDNNVLSLPPSIKRGDGTNVPHVAVGSGAAAAGTFSGADLPPQVAVLVKKLTDLGGKKNRGRLYIPWALPASVVDERGTIAPANVAAIQANINLFFNQLATDNQPMVISNKTLVLSPPDVHPHVTAITQGPVVVAMVVESIIATQRRRLPR